MQPQGEVAAEVRRGKVTKFDDARGFGFIAVDDGGADAFVHYSQIISDATQKTLERGQVVEFELGETEKGRIAWKVCAVTA